jgi:hypothetical protein
MKTFTTIAVLALAALLSGCASTGYNRAGNTAVSFQEASVRINKGAGEIDAALAALSQLVDNPGTDLKKQFKTFDTAVDKADSFARDLSASATRIQQGGAAYFQHWDDYLVHIQSEDIRKISADRRAAVSKQFDQVKQAYDESRGGLNAFVADLRDVRTSLSTDLTAGGLAAIKSTASKTSAKGVTVRQSLTDLAVKFKDMGTTLAASAPPTPAK